MTFYERIEELRKKKKISQGNLEKELGFSNGSYSKWKNSIPTHERLQKLADYFNVSVSYLLTGEEPERLYLDIKDIDAMKRGITSLGYAVSFEFSRNYGYTLVVHKQGHSQSIAFRNDEIIKYLPCLNSSNMETIGNAIEDKYANELYYVKKTEEQIIEETFNPANASDPAYQSTTCDTWVICSPNSTDENTNEEYYLNIETARMAQDIFENKELRVLFDAARDASPDDLQTVHSMLLALKRKEQGNID